MKRVSVHDVARDAGVSLGTVSNVFNNPDRVRPATRAKVEASVEKLGFVRNEQARALKSGSSTTVAYVMLNAGNPFFTELAAGMDEVLRPEGLTLFLCDSREDAAREDEYLVQLLQRRVHGVLVTGLDYDNPRLESFRAAEVPVIIVDSPPMRHDARWCAVSVDDDEGGELAVAHLLDQGHQHIAFAAGPAELTQVAQRRRGAERAVDDSGDSSATLTVLDTSALSIEAGRDLGARLLGLPKKRRPTAVFCGNDLLAIGLLQAVMQAGLFVPDDLAIVGYDDIVYAGAAAVPLTSVAQPTRQMGRAAAELMLAEVREGTGHTHSERVFRPELIARASSVSVSGVPRL
ncbi:MAG: LacI family DNA-binding transcriptional regulator [Actinomycetales bacterium]